MTTPSPSLPSAGELLASSRRLLAAYQRRVRARRVLRVSAGLGCLAALIWRGRHFGWPPLLLIGAGAAGLAALGWWQWSVSRREQLGAGDATLTLVRMLGLQARLITTLEFADRPQISSLYPMLAQETSAAIRGASARLPRAIDRPTMALGVALVLLLLLGSPLIARPTLAQLAALPSIPPPIPPQEPPPQPDQSNASQSPQQSGGASAQSQQNQQQQPSDGGQSQSSQGQQQQSGS